MPSTQSAAAAVPPSPVDESALPRAPATGAGRIGSTLAGRFVIEGLLAPGESGDYHAALDLGAGGLHPSPAVVIKIAHAGAGDAASLESFRHEYNQARRLSNPNIARVYDFFAEAGEAGYTLDLPPGTSLAHRMPTPSAGRLGRDYAWALIAATGRALVHAHLREVIHGSLCARSLWLTEERQLRVLEFGSRQEQPRPSPCSAEVARYASCDVLEGRAAGVSDDLYSLSCLAYELLAGQHPWAGLDATTARDRAMRPVRPPGLSAAEWRMLKAGLSLSRGQRPKSVREWLAALRLASKHERLPEMSVIPSIPTSGGQRQVALAVAVTAALGCGAWVWHSSHQAGDVQVPPTEMQNSGAAPAPAARPDAARAAGAASGPVAPLTPPAGAVAPDPSPDPAAARAAKHSSTPVRSVPIGAGLWFPQSQYTAAHRSRFVEVHVLRRGSTGETGFQWWTEADTAVAGVDFQAQAPAMQTIRAGAAETSLFIRIPDARSARRRFKVCASAASTAGATAPACVAILL